MTIEEVAIIAEKSGFSHIWHYRPFGVDRWEASFLPLKNGQLPALGATLEEALVKAKQIYLEHLNEEGGL